MNGRNCIDKGRKHTIRDFIVHKIIVFFNSFRNGFQTISIAKRQSVRVEFAVVMSSDGVSQAVLSFRYKCVLHRLLELPATDLTYCQSFRGHWDFYSGDIVGYSILIVVTMAWQFHFVLFWFPQIELSEIWNYWQRSWHCRGVEFKRDVIMISTKFTISTTIERPATRNFGIHL